MQNQTLLKISLIISLTGILILLLLSNLFQPKLIEIKDINELLLNQKVQVQGEITYIKDYDNFQILTINDQTGKIPILINKNPGFNLTINQPIAVIGRLTEYKNQLQITSDKIQIKR